MKVFLLIVGALVLLLLCPVRLDLKWSEELSATAGWLFLKFKLLPQPETQKNKSPKQKSPDSDQQSPKESKAALGAKPGELVAQYAGLIPALLGRLKKSVVYILRHIKVKKLRLDLLIAREDAAETAVAFGKANQAVYTALGLLQGLMKFRCQPEINIGFDYLGQQETACFSGRISIAPLFVLIGAVGLAIGVLWLFVTRKEE